MKERELLRVLTRIFTMPKPFDDLLAIPSYDRDVVQSLAEQLPGDRDAVLIEAERAVHDLHLAVLNGDQQQAEQATWLYEAVVYRINDCQFLQPCTFESVLANHETPRWIVGQHCRAVPGAVPMWGQWGEFEIATPTFKAHIEVRGSSELFRVGLTFNYQGRGEHKGFTGSSRCFRTLEAHRTIEEIARALMLDCVPHPAMSPA